MTESLLQNQFHDRMPSAPDKIKDAAERRSDQQCVNKSQGMRSPLAMLRSRLTDLCGWRLSLSLARKPLEQKHPVCCYQHIYNLRRRRGCCKKSRSATRWWVIWGMRSIRDSQPAAQAVRRLTRLKLRPWERHQTAMNWSAGSVKAQHLLLSWRASWRCQWQGCSWTRISLTGGTRFLISEPHEIFWQPLAEQRQRPFRVSEHFLTHTFKLYVLDEQSASKKLGPRMDFYENFG